MNCFLKPEKKDKSAISKETPDENFVTVVTNCIVLSTLLICELRSDKCWLAPVAKLTGGDSGNVLISGERGREGDFTGLMSRGLLGPTPEPEPRPRHGVSE